LEWVAHLLSPERVAAAGCFEPGAVGLLQKKVERVGQLSEMDDMALAGILSTQLVHDLFVVNYRRPDPLGEGKRLKIVRRGMVAPIADKAVDV
jgi:asparagine synthase (glutamine-hydrolysing)